MDDYVNTLIVYNGELYAGRIKVYYILGEETAQLINADLAKGITKLYTDKVSGSKPASGVYFYKLEITS